MGYCIQVANTDFRIKIENLDALWAAIQISDATVAQGALCIEDIFDEAGFIVSWRGRKEVSNIEDIEWEGDKYWSGIDDFLALIAPYVEDNCFIEVIGEEGDQWRWIFKDGKYTEKRAQIIWE